MRLLAEQPGMDEREMAHVEKILDGAQPRYLHRDRAAGHQVAVAFPGLGNIEDVALRLAETGPDEAVSFGGS